MSPVDVVDVGDSSLKFLRILSRKTDGSPANLASWTATDPPEPLKVRDKGGRLSYEVVDSVHAVNTNNSSQ